MSMPRTSVSAPEPRSALAGVWRSGPFGNEPLVIRERRLEIVQIAARPQKQAETNAALVSAFGISLPEPGRAGLAQDMAALWIAPATCLLTRAWQMEGGLFRKVTPALADLAACVDQTHGHTTLRLSGAPCRDVLAKGCRIDLHERVFGPGRTAVTPIAHVAAVLHQVDAAPTFDLIVPATLAQSFLEWLLASAAEFGADLR